MVTVTYTEDDYKIVTDAAHKAHMSIRDFIAQAAYEKAKRDDN
jgi:uncharacterized protein (DUF1778 family)